MDIVCVLCMSLVWVVHDSPIAFRIDSLAVPLSYNGPKVGETTQQSRVKNSETPDNIYDTTKPTTKQDRVHHNVYSIGNMRKVAGENAYYHGKLFPNIKISSKSTKCCWMQLGIVSVHGYLYCMFVLWIYVCKYKLLKCVYIGVCDYVPLYVSA